MIIETKNGVYVISEDPENINKRPYFLVEKTTKKSGKIRKFHAWGHQVAYWEKISI